jgi:hypothetical protein
VNGKFYTHDIWGKDRMLGAPTTVLKMMMKRKMRNP